MIRDFLVDLCRLVCSWWNVDRIRISSATGRLFAVVPGDRLLIGKDLYVVQRRSLMGCAEEPNSRRTVGVEYRLIPFSVGDTRHSDDHWTELTKDSGDSIVFQVSLSNVGGPATLRLHRDTNVEELQADEIIVLGTKV